MVRPPDTAPPRGSGLGSARRASGVSGSDSGGAPAQTAEVMNRTAPT